MPESHLPIWDLSQPIQDALHQYSRLTIVAPTGSGKTTQVPQMLAINDGPCSAGKIFILEPRRVAARNVAIRVAAEMGTEPGKAVGYQVRFDDNTSEDSKIIFMTEGLFLRRISANPDLNGVSCVIFDEFHERNIGSDTALALVKRLQEISRPDLKLIVMSATLEAEKVAGYLGNAPCLKAEGRQYPVDIHYLDYLNQNSFPPQLAAETAQNICQTNDPGDILIFMPGMGEIQQTLTELKSCKFSERVDFIPLHGELPPVEQDRAFAKSNNRKIIVSTNVAETSITIDGISHVIDSGLARVARYCPEKGINILELQPISRASAEQRAGRAGRTGPGTCFRLWTESSHLNRPEKPVPEIIRSDFSDTLLLLKYLNINDPGALEWLDAPTSESQARSKRLLIDLGALDPETEEITTIGKEMARLPVSPRLSRILIEAANRSCFLQAVLCVALISDREILLPLKKGRGTGDIIKNRKALCESDTTDFLMAIRSFELALKNRFSIDVCRSYGIHAQAARTGYQVFLKLIQACQKNGLMSDTSLNIDAVFDINEHILNDLRRTLFFGFPDHLARRIDHGTLKCEIAAREICEIAGDSIVQHSTLIFYATLRQTQSGLPIMQMNSQIEADWLVSDHGYLINDKIECEYSSNLKRVEGFTTRRFRDLVISSERNHQPPLKQIANCLANAALEEKFLLPEWNHEIEQRIARYNLVCEFFPELKLQNIDSLQKVEILSDAFQEVSLAKDAQKVKLLPYLMKWITQERWEWIEELAPNKLRLFDQKFSKLEYFDPLNYKKQQIPHPVAQVSLSECFVLAENPKVLDGKLNIKLRLLAPDGKKITETTDWVKFKIKEYPLIKSGLKSKYPGKFWP